MEIVNVICSDRGYIDEVTSFVIDENQTEEPINLKKAEEFFEKKILEISGYYNDDVDWNVVWDEWIYTYDDYMISMRWADNVIK
jgi:hypothetical protein